MVKTSGDQNSNLQLIKKFNAFLDKKSMRKTPERIAVLEHILTIDKHFTVDQLYQLMEDDCYHVSKATLYNTMELLMESGILRKHCFDGLPPQYELHRTMPHSHLICTSCGKVKEVRDNNLTAFMNARKYTAFTTSYYSLTVYGVCSTCMRRMKRETKMSPVNHGR